MLQIKKIKIIKYSLNDDEGKFYMMKKLFKFDEK